METGAPHIYQIRLNSHIFTSLDVPRPRSYALLLPSATQTVESNSGEGDLTA